MLHININILIIVVNDIFHVVSSKMAHYNVDYMYRTKFQTFNYFLSSSSLCTNLIYIFNIVYIPSKYFDILFCSIGVYFVISHVILIHHEFSSHRLSLNYWQLNYCAFIDINRFIYYNSCSFYYTVIWDNIIKHRHFFEWCRKSNLVIHRVWYCINWYLCFW